MKASERLALAVIVIALMTALAMIAPRIAEGALVTPMTNPVPHDGRGAIRASTTTVVAFTGSSTVESDGTREQVNELISEIAKLLAMLKALQAE